MAVITRYIPNSNPKRLQVLTTAKEKKDGLPPAGNILTPGTTSRLDSIQPQLVAALNLVSFTATESIIATAKKNEAAAPLRKFCSHYLQVLNLAVERDVYPKAVRALFKLNTETGSPLPDMDADADLEQVAKDIAEGEAQIVAHGGAPMSNPTAAEVAALLLTFKAKFTEHSNASQVLDAAQEAVDALVPETDKVIRKIYDEAEAHYNEEEAESMRADCRWWGVQYITIGNETVVTVHLKHTGTDNPVEGYAVKLVEASGKTIVTPANGTVVFNTKVVGDATLNIFVDPEHTGGTPFKTQTIVIVENVPLTVVVEV